MAAGLEAAARWEPAATAWAALAQEARAAGADDEARGHARRAADAFRRDDRPAAAVLQLRVAMAGTSPVGMDAALFGGLLADAGQFDAAASVLDEALAAESDAATRALLLDGACGVALARGNLAAARGRLAALEDLRLPGADLAATFRAATLRRLDGDLDAADAGWAALGQRLAGVAAAVGAVAAAAQERAELAVLRVLLADGGRVLPRASEGLAAARAQVLTAREGWTRAGRRLGVMRAEAWLARVDALAGVPVLWPRADDAIAYARARGLPGALADLLVCAAVVRDDPDLACQAVRCLDEAPLARGRARVLAWGLGARGGVADLERAGEELAGDVPWFTLARRSGA